MKALCVNLTRIAAAASLMVVMAGWTVAQDVIVTLIASATRDAPEQLPRLRRQLHSDFPTDLRNTPDFGYVALEFYVDEKGISVGGRREATLPAYFIAVETALGEGLNFEAARRARSQRPALFPLAQIGKTQKGDAVIEFLVDEDGHARLPRIVSASDASFGYSAVQALVEWQFDPPKSGGKPVVVRVRAPFKFTAPLANVP